MQQIDGSSECGERVSDVSQPVLNEKPVGQFRVRLGHRSRDGNERAQSEESVEEGDAQHEVTVVRLADEVRQGVDDQHSVVVVQTDMRSRVRSLTQ